MLVESIYQDHHRLLTTTLTTLWDNCSGGQLVDLHGQSAMTRYRKYWNKSVMKILKNLRNEKSDTVQPFPGYPGFQTPVLLIKTAAKTPC